MFCYKIVDEDSRNLVNPFRKVINVCRRHKENVYVNDSILM